MQAKIKVEDPPGSTSVSPPGADEAGGRESCEDKAPVGQPAEPDPESLPAMKGISAGEVSLEGQPADSRRLAHAVSVRRQTQASGNGSSAQSRAMREGPRAKGRGT